MCPAEEKGAQRSVASVLGTQDGNVHSGAMMLGGVGGGFGDACTWQGWGKGNKQRAKVSFLEDLWPATWELVLMEFRR